MLENIQCFDVIHFIKPGFWHKLADIKLNDDKLQETVHKIWGSHSFIRIGSPKPFVELDSMSFNRVIPNRNGLIPFIGTVRTLNTIEEFNQYDEMLIIGDVARTFALQLKDKSVIEYPEFLNVFVCLTFVNLKNYHFHYWILFPTIKNFNVKLGETINLAEKFSQDEVQEFVQLYLKWEDKCFFLVEKNASDSTDGRTLIFHTLKSKLMMLNSENYDRFFFAFGDPYQKFIRCQILHFLYCILYYCPFLANRAIKLMKVSICPKRTLKDSQILHVILPCSIPTLEELEWSKSDSDAAKPRMVDMRDSMDPKTLYAQSVDLNMKLMKWRLAPDVDLDRIAKTKCLLFGAGTLGCSVARNLVSWGVRCITFVDNGTVSYSNPVRQSLYTYQNAMDGAPKVDAAVSNLLNVFPDLECKGYNLTVLMPDHPISPSDVECASTRLQKIKELIESHDYVFLLTDSRESRWLPTLLVHVYGKTAITAAVGFESYLVMRYGGFRTGKPTNIPPVDGSSLISGEQLGCYFCSDITAPGNSLRDRTLDQQCTVTRPGAPLIAAALAVELAICVMQNEYGIYAPADKAHNSDNVSTSSFGFVPHTIRGFLFNYQQLAPCIRKFDKCVACSERVLAAYQNDGDAFLFQVFQSSKQLELSACLNDLHLTDSLAEVLVWDDNEGDSEEED